MLNNDATTNYRLKIYSVLLFLYFVLKPFYFFDTGLPQLADFVFIIFVLIILVSNDMGIYRVHIPFLFFVSLFLCYVIFVNGLWAMKTPHFEYLITVSIYLFNVLACFYILLLYRIFGNKLYQLIYFSVLFSVLVQLSLSLVIKSGLYRETLFFENPNQLGYYALLSLAIQLILAETIKVRKFWFYLSISGCLILTFISLSKAAILCSLIIVASAFLFSKKNVNFKSFSSIIFFMLLMVSSLFVVVPNNSNMLKDVPIISNVQARISDVGKDVDDNPAGRGYDRILNYPQYLLFGAGEGNYSNFKSKIAGSEIHSTIGTVLFSYGFIGASIFILWILYSIRGRIFWFIIPSSLIFVYGLAHNGLRQTFLWILITIIFIIKSSKSQRSKEKVSFLRE